MDTEDFISVRIELAKSNRSSHWKDDLIGWRSETRRRIKSDTKKNYLLKNIFVEIFVEKLNILSLSGFSWLGAVIQAVGNPLGDFPSSPEAELNFLKFCCWIWFRVEAFDFRSSAFLSL